MRKQSVLAKLDKQEEILPPTHLTFSSKVNSREGFPCSSAGKESAYHTEELGSIPWSGRSPGEGNGNPLQYSCLENPMDRGAWQAIVHVVARVGHNLATKPLPNSREHQIRPASSSCSPAPADWTPRLGAV